MARIASRPRADERRFDQNDVEATSTGKQRKTSTNLKGKEADLPTASLVAPSRSQSDLDEVRFDGAVPGGGAVFRSSCHHHKFS